MMTKKHYEAIAKVINNIYWQTMDGNALAVALDLAEYFKKDNPRFDSVKFLEACKK